MSAKSHPGQCQETPHPLRSRCPHSYAWASGSWLVRVAARQGAPTGPRPEPAPPSCPGLGVDSCVCHRTCWTSFSSGRGSPTLAFILTVGSNKLRCPGTLELIKPATETCRKLEPKLKERKKEEKEDNPYQLGSELASLFCGRLLRLVPRTCSLPQRVAWGGNGLLTPHSCRELPLK